MIRTTATATVTVTSRGTWRTTATSQAERTAGWRASRNSNCYNHEMRGRPLTKRERAEEHAQESRAARRARHAAVRRPRRPVWLLPLVILVAIAGIAAGYALLRGDSASPERVAAFSDEPFQGGPRLAVDRTSQDDGAVQYGEEVKATFRLKNVGDQALAVRTPTVETLEGC